MRTLVILTAIAAFLQQPAFRSRVELLRLDVSVVDGEGRPVRDLRAEDFSVTLDGRPRQVASARFYGPAEGPRAALSETPVSVATNTNAPPGRILVIVADLESMMPGYEKLVFDAAAGVVDNLAAADAVGLMALPGRSVELTRDHAKVRDALRELRGSASPPTSNHTMSVREAEAFRAKDQRVIAEVIERECRPSDSTCAFELSQEVMPILIEADRRTQMLAGALTSLLARLERIEAPKAVVVLSAGLRRRQGSTGYFKDLERRADTAGVTMSIVQVEQPEHDASRRGPGGVISRADLNEGLSAIAGATGAAMYYGIARAVGPFDRIRNEIVHSYQLGVESSAADADGKKHRLQVEVKRKGVTVRARKEVVVPATAKTVVSPVDLLAQPIDFSEAPLTVATYVTRGEEPSTLKLIVLVELAGAPAEGSASYAFSIVNDEKPVFETADRIPAGSAGTAAAAQIPPGRYRLRAAVLDASGRPGSLDMPIVVGLRQAGDLQLSDLILGRGGETFVPSVRVPAATPIAGILELYSADPAALDGVSVTLELRRPGETAPTTRVACELRKTSLERRRIATATLPVEALSSRTWLVSAVVRRGETIVGQVSRTITVDPVSGADPVRK